MVLNMFAVVSILVCSVLYFFTLQNTPFHFPGTERTKNKMLYYNLNTPVLDTTVVLTTNFVQREQTARYIHITFITKLFSCACMELCNLNTRFTNKRHARHNYMTRINSIMYFSVYEEANNFEHMAKLLLPQIF
jgi:hypothetical protein